MKFIAFTMLLAGSIMISGTVYADADDEKWINQCIADNSGATVSAEVVKTYCICMNNKMENEDTLSITQWEKNHVAERDACDKEAGWK